MRKIGILLVVILISCTSKDERFCNCMEIGSKFNQVSNKLLQDESNETLKNEFIQLKKAKLNACKKYETMGGKELLDKKQACEND